MHSRQSSTLSILNPKSSVLCTNTNHITSQYLALEQIKAHQDMLSRAKVSVDTSAPKSLQSYLNDINKKKKSCWQQEMHFPTRSKIDSSSFSHLYHPKTVCRETNTANKDENLDISTSVNKSIQTGVPFSPCHSKVADKISWYLEAVSQGEFQQVPKEKQTMSGHHFRHSGSLMSLSSSLRSGRIVKGDLLEWHKSSFTSQPKAFSPKVLANNSAKSKVIDMRCYNPPHRRRKESSSIHSSDTFESLEDEENDVEPSQENDGSDNDDVEEEEDYVEEQIDKPEDEVPMDSKSIHQDWLNEQAIRAQLRRNFKTKTAKNSPVRARQFKSRMNNLKFNTLSRDEEEKYLKFLSDVTDDILRSGIYTDSAIERAFQLHLQFYSRDTDKEKLQHLLAQVLSGLQLHNEDNECQNSNNQKQSALLKDNSSTIQDTERKNFVANILNQVKNAGEAKMKLESGETNNNIFQASDQIENLHEGDNVDITSLSSSSGKASENS